MWRVTWYHTFSSKECHADTETEGEALYLLALLHSAGVSANPRNLDTTGECPYTHAHTRHWCGYDTCREG